MKKVIVLLMIIFSFSDLYSQDCIDRLLIMKSENDSLYKQVIKPLNDSIIKLNTANSIEFNNKEICFRAV